MCAPWKNNIAVTAPAPPDPATAAATATAAAASTWETNSCLWSFAGDLAPLSRCPAGRRGKTDGKLLTIFRFPDH